MLLVSCMNVFLTKLISSLPNIPNGDQNDWATPLSPVLHQRFQLRVFGCRSAENGGETFTLLCCLSARCWWALNNNYFSYTYDFLYFSFLYVLYGTSCLATTFTGKMWFRFIYFRTISLVAEDMKAAEWMLKGFVHLEWKGHTVQFTNLLSKVPESDIRVFLLFCGSIQHIELITTVPNCWLCFSPGNYM